MGSAKYDVAARDPLSAQTAESMLRAAGVGASSLTLVGGSTWPGEEAALLDVYGRLKGAFPNLRLVLVPRHAERRRAVLDEICRRNLTVALRSELRDSAGSPPEPPDVLLVDTTGELRHLYAVGTVIFVGKSLTRRGGQNLIEAAVCGRPILVGPHMENFAGVMKDFLDGEAVVQVANAGELEAAVARLLEDTRLRQAYGERAAAVVARKRGAIAATAAAAAALLPPTVPSV
jgi:3-deoxy-D-manno-octulosonic-acid transferase